MSETEALGAEVAAVFTAQRLRVSEQQQAQFAAYLQLLEKWNQRVSLTSITDRDTAILRHFVEPAMMLPALAGAGPRILDVGSGAGCPGLPLKILDPGRDVWLVEANSRKAAFLREVIDAAELEGIEVLEGRLEQLVATAALQGPVHVLTSRAWDSGWGAMLGLIAPLMTPGGRALLLTGDRTLRALRRNLAPRSGAEVSGDPDWRTAVQAAWQIRKATKLPHLEGLYLVALELPGG